MAKVFPEEMNRLDPANVGQSFRTVEDYIRYITERVEFSLGASRRIVSESGITDLAVVSLLTEMNGTLKSLESEINSVKSEVSTLRDRVAKLES